MTPQNATLDSKRTLSWFVSYQRLSSQFQFSLSAVTLGYLSQCSVQPPEGHSGQFAYTCVICTPNFQRCGVRRWCGVAQLWCGVAQSWCGVAQLWCSVAQLWCGVAQLVARRLAGRQALVRFSARHHREVFPTEHKCNEDMERGCGYLYIIIHTENSYMYLS